MSREGSIDAPLDGTGREEKMKAMINSCAIARVSEHSQKEPSEKQWEQFSDELRMFLGFRVQGELFIPLCNVLKSFLISHFPRR